MGKERRSTVRLPLAESPAELRLRTWVQFIRVYQRLSSRVEQSLALHGLTTPQFDVLATLAAGEGITQQELAERLLVTKGNVVGLLNRMETLKWVERRADPTDKRANRLYLTSAGREVFERIMPGQVELVQEMLKPLSDADAKTLRHFLEDLDAD
jgi:DNA-binding MarR family transcriptional regulator